MQTLLPVTDQFVLDSWLPQWAMAADPTSGGMYYYNKATGAVQWDPPPGWLGHTVRAAYQRPVAPMQPSYQPQAYPQHAYQQVLVRVGVIGDI